jgi:hypothetical protein
MGSADGIWAPRTRRVNGGAGGTGPDDPGGGHGGGPA